MSIFWNLTDRRANVTVLVLCYYAAILYATLCFLTDHFGLLLSPPMQRTERWRRLRDWSFCLFVVPCVCVCLCTQWHIIIFTCHTQPAGTLAPSSENFYIGEDMHSYERLLVTIITCWRESIVVNAADIWWAWLAGEPTGHPMVLDICCRPASTACHYSHLHGPANYSRHCQPQGKQTCGQ